ncbi:hypothetical protein [Methanimicrococcus blatticola]|nr:hypothetical protein [Methanimicrococcus blatticola]
MYWLTDLMRLTLHTTQLKPHTSNRTLYMTPLVPDKEKQCESV